MKCENNWKLTPEGDIKIGNIGIIVTKGKETIKQRIILKLQLFFGEYFLHEFEGIQWVNTFEHLGQIGKKINEINILEQIKKMILADKDVKDIVKLTNNFRNETGSYNIELDVLLKDHTILSIN